MKKESTLDSGEIKLRVSDQLIINYEFELHFHGVSLPSGMNITRSLCVEWKKKVDFLQSRKTGENHSMRLDRLFEEHFGVKLLEGKHVTIELCSGWYEKHSNFLANIILQRARNLPPPRKEDM